MDTGGYFVGLRRATWEERNTHKASRNKQQPVFEEVRLYYDSLKKYEREKDLKPAIDLYVKEYKELKKRLK